MRGSAADCAYNHGQTNHYDVSNTTAFESAVSRADWAAHAANRYQIFPNLTYLTASNHELKLDIHKRRDTTGPQPTIIYMHGGFWAAGTKEGALMTLMPWFEGWKAVMLHQALAKAGTPNQLLTIPGGRHGGFTPEERTRIYTVVREFLAQNGLGGK